MSKKAKEFPQGFTLSLALMDFVPVIFFSAGALVVGMRMHSLLFSLGAIGCIFAGCGKVLWKILLASAKKDIRPLNTQMRYLMPLGFILMILGWRKDPLPLAVQSFFTMPSVLFFGIGLAGIAAMTVLGIRNQTTDVKANWIEQCVNCVAQGAFFLGIVFFH